MLSCILSLQAALSRLIFSFSRDRMLPGSEWMAKISKNSVPDNAMLVSCVLPVIFCIWVYFQPDNLAKITAFAVIGIYISFQMVVLAALRQRLKGWKPAGEWSLGAWGKSSIFWRCFTAWAAFIFLLFRQTVPILLTDGRSSSDWRPFWLQGGICLLLDRLANQLHQKMMPLNMRPSSTLNSAARGLFKQAGIGCKKYFHKYG